MAAVTPRIVDVANEEVEKLPEYCDGYRNDLVLALSQLIRSQVGRTEKQRQEDVAKHVDLIAARVISVKGRGKQ
jgi:hypothetical protein